MTQTARVEQRSASATPAAPLPAITRRAIPRVYQQRSLPLFVGACFAWLHTPMAEYGSDTAILMCPPVGWDAVHSHHALRLLATSLAASGYPALRFNYPSTGDSADTGEEPWGAWQRSLNEMADWLLQTTGASRLVLAGLRLGATLAMLAAETRADVAGLLLLAPVLRGHSYLRQLSVEAQLQTGWCSKDGGLEFLELGLSAETLGVIGRVDLRDARLRPGVRVGIFQPAATRLADQCAQQWAAHGIETVKGGFDGLEAMLLPTIDADPPPVSFRAVSQWLQRAVPNRETAQLQPPPPSAGLALTNGVETPLCFGAGNQLFGILCEPRSTANDLAVLIVNTGRDPHYGVARFGVEFARRLAAEGTASFRFDFAGLGDSAGPPGREDVLGALFETCRTADISAAIDALQRRGYRRFAVHGLCSGAYHGFHAALADDRITVLLLVNILMLKWQRLGLADLPRHYAQQLRNPALWSRLLRGDPALFAGVGSLCGRLWQKAVAALAPLDIPWLRTFERRAMAALSERRVRSLFLFAAGEPGIALVKRAFGPTQSDPNAAVVVVPEFDHVLTGRTMRLQAAEMMITFLVSRF